MYAKKTLPSDQGPTYFYAKIIMEATLANKRARVMPLMHILKFIFKKHGKIHQLVSK